MLPMATAAKPVLRAGQDSVADDGTAEGFLKAQKPAAAHHLKLVVAAGVANGLLIIAQAWFVARIITAALFEGATLADVGWALALLPPIFLIRFWLTAFSERASFQAAAVVKRNVRADLLQHLTNLGPVRLAGRPTGAVATAVTDSIEAIQPYYARYLPAVSITSVLPIAIFLVVLPSDWISGIVFLVTAPLIPLFMILIGRGAEKMNQKQWAGLVRMSGHLLDVIQGLTTLKLFNASRREGDAVSAMAEAYRRDTMSVLRVAFLSSLALEFFATVSIALIAVLIGFRLLWGEIGFFQGFFVLLLAPEFYAPLRSLGVHYHARMEAIGAAEAVVGFLGVKAPVPPEATGTAFAAAPEIVFENVAISFDDGRQGLAGLSFKIAAGERVALVGPSGSGKSTVLNLLLGFITPTSGRILIDGKEVDTAGREWRAAVAWVAQRPHLFRAAVTDNIAMTVGGDMDGVGADMKAAGVADMDAVEAAARAAQADQVIDGLADGYQTRLGDGGGGLSGGERQRIALARAFFRKPRLVLLDEPTAHLDRATEIAVMAATDRLVAGATSLTIAHRLETVERADRILVLDHGTLAESGRHGALLAKGGLYARLARSRGFAHRATVEGRPA